MHREKEEKSDYRQIENDSRHVEDAVDKAIKALKERQLFHDLRQQTLKYRAVHDVDRHDSAQQEEAEQPVGEE